MRRSAILAVVIQPPERAVKVFRVVWVDRIYFPEIIRFSKFHQTALLVFGAAFLDRFSAGQSDHLDPPQPLKTLHWLAVQREMELGQRSRADPRLGLNQNTVSTIV